MPVHRAVAVVIALAAVAISSVAVAQQPAGQAADEVIRITRALWAADAQKDLAGAMKNIADDYTEFNPQFATRLDGKALSRTLTDAGHKAAGRTLVSEMANPKVQVYGNVAILSYNFVGVAQDKDGVNQTIRAKSTRVYVRQGNDWMLVHANFGADPLPEN